MRLIDADRAREKSTIDLITHFLDRQPTIDPESLRAKGRWDASGRYTFEDGSLAVRCNICGASLHEDEWQKYNWNYCPNCGADMKGEK